MINPNHPLRQEVPLNSFSNRFIFHLFHFHRTLTDGRKVLRTTFYQTETNENGVVWLFQSHIQDTTLAWTNQTSFLFNSSIQVLIINFSETLVTNPFNLYVIINICTKNIMMTMMMKTSYSILFQLILLVHIRRIV